MKAAINNTLIRTLPEGRDLDIRDTRLPGFVLRVRTSGRAAYRVQYARGRWVTLGRLSDLTPAEAREQAKKILGEAAKGNDPAAARKKAKAATLRDFLNRVYEPWLATNLKTGQAQADRLRACFGADMGRRQLPDLTPWLVEKWRTARLKAGRKPSTVNRDLNTLKAMLSRAVEWGYITENPMARLKPVKVDTRGKVRFLSADEAEGLREALAEREQRIKRERASANSWRAARGYPTMADLFAVPYADYLCPLVLLAVNTGMRRGELFNLRWRDIDLSRAQLTVQGSGAKSGQTRHLPLNSEAVQVLRDWRRSVDGDGFVFAAADGGRLDNVKRSWANVLAAAGIENFRFHDLRHTFASWLVMAGTDLYTVRDLLGHSSITMTERYAHLAPEHRARAVEALRAPEASAT